MPVAFSVYFLGDRHHRKSAQRGRYGWMRIRGYAASAKLARAYFTFMPSAWTMIRQRSRSALSRLVVSASNSRLGENPMASMRYLTSGIARMSFTAWLSFSAMRRRSWPASNSPPQPKPRNLEIRLRRRSAPREAPRSARPRSPPGPAAFPLAPARPRRAPPSRPGRCDCRAAPSARARRLERRQDPLHLGEVLEQIGGRDTGPPSRPRRCRRRSLVPVGVKEIAKRVRGIVRR